MNSTPRSLRLQIGLFGRVNVGKSSLLNYLAGQDVAITSPTPGTTTDVVEKPMELLPVGPVVFLDTAGLDDRSELGTRRLQKTAAVYARADCFVLVTEPGIWTEFEETVRTEAARRHTPCLTIVNKIDLPPDGTADLPPDVQATALRCSCRDAAGQEAFLTAFTKWLRTAAPPSGPTTIAGDLVPAGGLAVLVVPIDLQAPAGRLILPQVQTIRDLLNNDAAALVVKEREYAEMLKRLTRPPDLVICDSQAVLKVTADTPPAVPCTTFSILFARFKGDLDEAARGGARLERLRPGDRVLVAEACTHHALEDDIGRIKIPRWLRQFAGEQIRVDTVAGRDYPADLADYRVIIHCGGCMLNRKEMLSRIETARDAGVPITNYGVSIAAMHGVLERVLAPFPSALESYRKAQ